MNFDLRGVLRGPCGPKVGPGSQEGSLYRIKGFLFRRYFFFAFLGLKSHLEAKHRLLLLGKALLSLVHLKEIKIIFITINTGLSLLSSYCCHNLLSIIIIINTFVITTTIVIHMSINNQFDFMILPPSAAAPPTPAAFASAASPPSS